MHNGNFADFYRGANDASKCVAGDSAWCRQWARKAQQIGPILRDISVFEWLSDGYKTFRIPGIVQSANGTLIAATEGRVAATRPAVGNASLCYGVLASKYDGGCVDKDIVIKLSSDGGERWRTESNATRFYSNPNLLLDRNSSVVWMVYYQCLVAEVYRYCIPVMTSSKDNGVTRSSGKLIDGENWNCDCSEVNFVTHNIRLNFNLWFRCVTLQSLSTDGVVALFIDAQYEVSTEENH